MLISRIFPLLRETDLIISDSIETDSPVETEIVRVVSLSTTEITGISQLKKKLRSGSEYRNNMIIPKYSSTNISKYLGGAVVEEKNAIYQAGNKKIAES